MRVLNIAGLAILFAVVGSTTSTASSQRWATKPYETPGGYTRPAMRPNVHAPHYGMASTMSGQHHYRPKHYQPMTAPDQADAEENTGPLVMTEDMIEENSMAGEQEPNVHMHHHTGVTSSMSGQNSSPVSSETMTDDHPEHHHRPRPVMTQKPGPMTETPLMSSEADSEEHTMPPVMTEDNPMLTNAIESNEAMTEEMSEHDQMISVHEFKGVLHELVKDAVDKIALKKAGFVGKLKTAKRNLLGHDGKATGRDPQQFRFNLNALCHTRFDCEILVDPPFICDDFGCE